jgi:hypothetical protein
VLREAPLVNVAGFLIGGLSGMSLALVALKPENDFTLTFVGWLLAGTVATSLLYLLPEARRLLGGFWGLGGARREQD